MNNKMGNEKYTNFVRNRDHKISRIYDANLKTHLQILCKNSRKL